jgi:hypothetical protein
MATAPLPLNTFRTRPFELTTSTQTIYTTPPGFTCIVLGAQASNIGTGPVTITFTLTKNDVDYVLLKAFEIPINDAVDLISGKLVIEQNAYVKAFAGANDSVNLVLSILETTNE